MDIAVAQGTDAAALCLLVKLVAFADINHPSMIAPSLQVSSATNDGVQMPHCTQPDEVSGGELQRLAIARFLLFKPICLVADEPTSRLDPLVQRQTIELLRDLVDEQRMSLLLTSHDLRLVRAVADDVVQLVTWNQSKPHFVQLLSQEQEFVLWLAGRRTSSF